MHHREWGLGKRLQNADTCVSKEPKYRGLDGEATECRLCKHCGCALNVSQVAQRRLDPHADQKQEINFVWLDSTSCQWLWSMIGFSAALRWTGRPPWLHSQKIFCEFTFHSWLDQQKYFNNKTFPNLQYLLAVNNCKEPIFARWINTSSRISSKSSSVVALDICMN